MCNTGKNVSREQLNYPYKTFDLGTTGTSNAIIIDSFDLIMHGGMGCSLELYVT